MTGGFLIQLHGYTISAELFAMHSQQLTLFYYKLSSSLVTFKICLRFPSGTLFVSVAAPPKKYAGSTPEL